MDLAYNDSFRVDSGVTVLGSFQKVSGKTNKKVLKRKCSNFPQILREGFQEADINDYGKLPWKLHGWFLQANIKIVRRSKIKLYKTFSRNTGKDSRNFLSKLQFNREESLYGKF